MSKSQTVLWLCPPNFSGGLLKLQQRYLQRAGFNLHQFRFLELTRGCMKKRTKTIWDVVENKKSEFLARIERADPDFIVINDRASLKYLTGKYTSLALCRGGVYYHTVNGRQIPCLVIDDIKKTKSTRPGGWLLLQDLGKLRRWLAGAQRIEPQFQYRVARAVDDVREFADTIINAGTVVAIDIETTGVTISCIGYSIWAKDGKALTFVIPFYNTTRADGCHWRTPEDEEAVWAEVRRIHDSPIPKCMQNGSYDATYFLVYRCPLRNYLLDTLHLWHSVWPEAPKRLDYMASVAMDFYRYWKDEGKEDAAEDNKAGVVPRTAEGLANYWLYNALDCHNTLMVLKFLAAIVSQQDWARQNYVMEFELQFGPLIRMSMAGIKVNDEIQAGLYWQNIHAHESASLDLMTMVGDPTFNPNSPQQVQTLLYDILLADELPRKGRSTDETVLKLVATQNVILDKVINQIWLTKKPANNASKYGTSANIKLNGRLMFKLYAAGTPTQRLSSKKHDLWVGTNSQNAPKSMRVMLEADDGRVLVDIDYSQSDAYFTAYTSGDPNYIRTMQGENGVDTHCYHAQEFFKIPYAKLVEGHEQGADWVDHPTKGIRQITKRIVYGSNYFMTGYTLFIQMGKAAVVAAAKFLGNDDSHLWTIKQLAQFCDALLAKYFEMYPDIDVTITELAQTAMANGNKAATAWGYTRVFFGDLRDDKVRREFAAFFGQGGTAGNINKAIKNIWRYERKHKAGIELKAQVHDSLIIQIPKDKLNLIPKCQQLMENECTINGRTFTVPTEAAVGYGWGKRMIPYRPGITIDDINKHERAWWAKWHDEHTSVDKQ